MIGTIRLVIRKDKPRKSTKCPIELIYSIEGQRKYLNTGINLFPDNWDGNRQVAAFYKSKDPKYLSKMEIEDVNRDFLRLKDNIADTEKLISLGGEVLSSNLVIERYKAVQRPATKKEESSKFIFDFIDKYIEENAPSRAKGSLSVYKALKNHLFAYQQLSKNRVKISEIDYLFFQSFNNFLIKHRNINNITIAKQISTLKTFLGYAKKNGVNINDSYKDFSVKKQKLEVIALTEAEFMKLYNLDLIPDNKFEYFDNKDQKRIISYAVLDKVRDVFCFSCTTGFRYSDLGQLRREHIKGARIKLTIKKTKEILTVPLNAYADRILDKYKDQYFPLPVISNQKYNDYIKLLCELAEINEPVEIIRFKGAEKIITVYPKHQLISSHTGRKTFCTLSLERGIPAETVMKISGHSDYRSFQRYVKVTEKRKENEMHKAWGAPNILKIVNE